MVLKIQNGSENPEWFWCITRPVMDPLGPFGTLGPFGPFGPFGTLGPFGPFGPFGTLGPFGPHLGPLGPLALN